MLRSGKLIGVMHVMSFKLKFFDDINFKVDM